MPENGDWKDDFNPRQVIRRLKAEGYRIVKFTKTEFVHADVEWAIEEEL